MFSGKVVIITGASSGIGAGTAIRFASEGAKLALTGRNTENLQDVAQKCEAKSGEKPLTISADLSKDDDVKNIVDTTIKVYGKLDVLVNNAGIFFLGDVLHTDMEKYDQTFATNTRAVFLLTSLALPHLIESKGNVVNVSSVAGLRPYFPFTAYCMTKAALDQFTRCLALEVAPKQVRVNSVNPGVVATNIHQRASMTEEQIQQLFDNTKTSHPLGRPGTVDEVAEAILFLASDKASFTTGATLTVDGGCEVNSSL